MTRRWIVTGCSSGIGRAVAEQLLTRGERVALGARSLGPLEALAAPHGDRALPLKLDVTDPASVAAAVAAANERFGGIDVLVNNAGYGHMGSVEDTPETVARALMDTNYFGALAMIRAVLPAMRTRGSGQIVNVGSVAGRVGFPMFGYYAASKFALAGLTQALGTELEPSGIKVTLVEPGPFDSGFVTAMAMTLPEGTAYDPSALSQRAGTGEWTSGDSCDAGATAMLSAIDQPNPPRELILGQAGLDVIARYDALRTAERAQWLTTSRLEIDA